VWQSATVAVAGASDRVVSVAPERLTRWIAGFGERHLGVASAEAAPDRCLLVGADGVRAEIEVPFPPLTGSSVADLVAHALRDRVVGVLLVRLGGHAAGVFEGSVLVASKVGSRPVHSRHKAGGWSQQRFARRREQQVAAALAAAADVAVGVLLPYAGELDALVLGGDRRAVEAVLADRRLAPLVPLVAPRFLNVPDPRLDVLRSTPPLFRAVQVRLVEPTAP
jgi:VLRF1 release factor-like protein